MLERLKVSESSRNITKSSLLEMAHIRSYFGIEREFDRYYHLLKSQLRDGTNFDDNREDDEIQIAASRTFDAEKVW